MNDCVCAPARPVSGRGPAVHTIPCVHLSNETPLKTAKVLLSTYKNSSRPMGQAGPVASYAPENAGDTLSGQALAVTDTALSLQGLGGNAR